MRVVHLNTSDAQGGAARAAFRLHRGLTYAGVDSLMLVRDRIGDDERVRALRGRIARLLASCGAVTERVAALVHPRRSTGTFGASLVPDRVPAEVRALAPDVVNVHWIGGGFVSPESVARLGPHVVWTLHDTYAFTGGCHYFGACEAYTVRCGACPALGSRTARDLSRLGWVRKRRSWRRAGFTVVAPSRWIAECARRSSLLRGRRVEVIPNAIDTEVFRPLDRAEARRTLGLPLDRPLAAFVAATGVSDPKKGFHYLAAATRKLAAERGLRLELAVAGAASGDATLDCGVPVRWLGPIADDRLLAAVNAAADVVVVPSVQENLANTVLEALACGAPVVAFRIGGMPDMIVDRENGALVEPFDVPALAAAIRWVVEDPARRRALSTAARRRAEACYALEVQARRYLALYDELLRNG